MATTFGDNLKKIRSDKNISQGDLANMVNMHATHISRYERNQASPSVDILRKIADALNVSADVLIYGNADERAKSNIQDQELLNMFTKVQLLNKNELNCVKSVLKAYTLVADLQVQLPKR